MRWGLKAIIAESYAEIFFGNCCSLGIAAVLANREDIDKLGAAVEADPSLEVTVDLEAGTATAGDIGISISMPDSAKDALVSGEWDYLGQLLSTSDQVKAHAATVPYLNNFS